MARPLGGSTDAGPSSARLAWRAAAWLVPVLLAASAAGCAAPSRGSANAATVPGRPCRVGRPVLLADPPAFVTIVRQDFTQPPGDPGLDGHPSPGLTQYVCGYGAGFVSDHIMYGTYRAQDNALARSLGYQVGKYPLVPYVGTAVSALPHQVLEAYETILQFRSAKAAAAYLGGAQPSPRLAGSSLPPGFTAQASVVGPDDGRHERRISITGHLGAYAITLDIAGGKDLSWPDIQPTWASAYHQLTRSLTSRPT
jgi:hypothetical protein